MRSDDETEFVPLDRWEQEYKFFQKLVTVSTIVEDKNTCQAGIDRLLNKYEFYHYGFDHNDQ